jgi:hypothetical protein
MRVHVCMSSNGLNALKLVALLVREWWSNHVSSDIRPMNLRSRFRKKYRGTSSELLDCYIERWRRELRCTFGLQWSLHGVAAVKVRLQPTSCAAALCMGE